MKHNVDATSMATSAYAVLSRNANIGRPPTNMTKARRSEKFDLRLAPQCGHTNVGLMSLRGIAVAQDGQARGITGRPNATS